jgi:co-chaperonin GroES (HSP10)
MGSLIVPASVAQARRAQIAQRGVGLGKMQHDVDPAQKIYTQIGITKLGEVPGYTLHGNRVLVGIYERPEKLASGILLTDKTRQEDEHQGKAALVLMMGHSAFISDDHFDFGPDNVKPGDWIALWITEGRKIIINGQLCRIIRDQDINMKIPAPDSVY